MAKGKAIKTRAMNRDITTDASKIRNRRKRGSQRISKGSAHHVARQIAIDKTVGMMNPLRVSTRSPLWLNVLSKV